MYFKIHQSEWSQSYWRVFHLVDFVFVVHGNHRRRLYRLNLWCGRGHVVCSLLSRSVTLNLQHSIQNILMQKANIVKHLWCWLWNHRMMVDLELLVYVVAESIWSERVQEFQCAFDGFGWLIQTIGACPLMQWHMPLCVHFFKGENLLFLECQSGNAHVWSWNKVAIVLQV